MARAKYNTSIVVGKNPDGTYIRKYFSADTKDELNLKVIKYKEENNCTKHERWVKVTFYD